MPHGELPRLSAKERTVLMLLVRAGQMYGLELVTGSGGQLKRGTIYVTLQRMESKGYVTSQVEDQSPSTGGLPRRLYSPTALGRRVLDAWTHAMRRFAPEVAG